MASKKDAIRLTDEDFETKSFKTAPGGKYKLKPNKSQSKIKPGSDGNIMQLVLTISKGPHKGVNVFDNIAPHVGWKIAQLLKGIGISKEKAKKYKTIQDILKVVLAQTEIGAVIKETKSADFGKQNKIVQYLPPGAEEEEDDDIEEEEDDSEDEETDEDSDEDDEEDSDDESEEDDDEESEDDDEESEDDDEEEEDDEDSGEEEEDDEEDEEEEEEVKPAKKKPAAKKAPAKKTAKKRK